MRIITRFFLFIAASFGLCLGIAWITLPASADLSYYTEKASDYRVEIIRDSLGIPHIYGETDTDIAFGLGFAHSEDDFATIHDVLLATRGLLASEYGYSAAKTDYVVGFMGVWEAIETNYDEQVPAEIQAIADAYADGVNLYAATRADEFSRFLFPVTGKDIVAGFTFKTPMFYGFDKILGELNDQRKTHELAKTPPLSFQWRETQDLQLGSQGIAIAPHRSKEGQTHLLINSHQPLSGPVSWYEARLHSEEGWNMAGGTFPGSPVIIHGHNDQLGWANTVNKPDLVDIYRLELNPENENQYLFEGKWLDFDHRTAPILIRFLGPLRWTFKKDIKISRHGPVLQTDAGNFAIKWAGKGEVRTLEFMYRLNKASNMQEFEEALKMQAMPSINYIYADKEGNIAHYYNAMFPERVGQWEWQKHLPGDREELIWKNYRSFGQMPKTVNPESGLVFNANNTPFHATDGSDEPDADDFPSSMGIELNQTNRSIQIEALLRKQQHISREDLIRVKFDKRYHQESVQATMLSKWLQTQPQNEFTDSVYLKAVEQLKQWDLSFDKDNKNAALALFILEPVQNKGNRATYEEMSRAFEKGVSLLFDHYGTTEVAYGRISRLERGSKSLPIAGGPDVLRAVYPGVMTEEGTRADQAGDGFTMVVSWDDNGLVSSEAIHQYGAATNERNSPHYNDQMETFVEEKFRNVPFVKDSLLMNKTKSYRPSDFIKNVQ